MKYTRKQLIKAQIKYNEEFLSKPEGFDEIENTDDCAERQIDHLLSKVE